MIAAPLCTRPTSIAPGPLRDRRRLLKARIVGSYPTLTFEHPTYPNQKFRKTSLWDKPFNCYLFQPGIKQLYFEELDCTLGVDIDSTMYPVLRFQQGKGVRHSDIVCRIALLLLYDLGIVVLAPLCK